MAVQTAERTETDIAAEVPTTKGEVVHIAPPRLPYHPAIQERFGVDRSGWRVLVDATFPSAKSVEAILMALAYCQTRKLDVFKRPVHIVPMWSSKIGDYVETVWPGIAELRTTAFRTKQYAGCDEATFGPMVEQSFTGRIKVKGNWEEKTVQVEFPEWCRITVYRELNGRVCKFVGPKVKWIESCATIGSSDIPNDMWQGRPEGQLEKCAEAAALRKAFPEELGNQLTAEEMEGRRIYEPGANAKDVTPREEPPAPPPVSSGPAVDAEAIEEAPPLAPTAKAAPEAKPQQTAKIDDAPQPDTEPDQFLKWLDTKLQTFTDMEAMETYWNDHIAPRTDSMFPPDQEEAIGVYRKHEKRLAP